MTERERPEAGSTGDGEATAPPRRSSALVIEAVLGLLVAGLLAWTAIAAVTDVPFVYQGL